MKKLLAILLGLALVLSLAACGQSAPTAGGTAAPQAGTETDAAGGSETGEAATASLSETPEATQAPEAPRKFVAEHSGDGYIYEEYSDRTATITKYTGDVGELTIPAELDGLAVTEIGEEAFAECRRLTDVVIPDSVTKIAEGAFINRGRLMSYSTVTKTETVESEGLTFHCTEGGYAWTFAEENGILHEVLEAGESLTGEAEAPREVVALHSEGAYNYFEYSDQTAEIIGYSGSDTELMIPASLGGLAVKTINTTFSDTLTSLIIPEGVTEIGNGAFHGCTALASVTLPNSLIKIGEGVFSNCNHLVSITLPDNVVEIGAHTFSACRALTGIVIPAGVTEIKESTFASCTALTSVTIPDGVTMIGEGAFDDCPALTLHCSEGSYAWTYAEENGIPHEAA